MANGAQRDAGTTRLIGAASILIATAIGYFLDPLNNAMLSAGLLGMVAGVSFAMRALFKRK